MESHEMVMEDGSMVATEVIAIGDAFSYARRTKLCKFQEEIIESGDMVVGLDITWPSDFKRNNSEHRSGLLLILCTQIRCVIIRIWGFCTLLQEFFDNKDITFVGVHIRDDVEKLMKIYGLGFRNSVVELNELAAEVLHQPRLRALGARRLASEVLMVPFKTRSVAMMRANWIADSLTKDHIECATIDAYVAYKIGKKLLGVQVSLIFDSNLIDL